MDKYAHGVEGEETAKKYLESIGYEIIDSNVKIVIAASKKVI